MGACGVIWALHYLQDIGEISLRKNYLLRFENLYVRPGLLLREPNYP